MGGTLFPAGFGMDWTAIVPLAALVVLGGVILALILVRSPRRQQTQDTSPPAPLTPPIDTVIQDTALQSLSSRLAVVEGRIGAIAATLEGVHILQQRVAAIETNMPAAQEAMEKYADSITRADKRDTERQRRHEKVQGQTAGEAAAALSGAVEHIPAPTAPQNNDAGRPGILGHGGRGR